MNEDYEGIKMRKTGIFGTIYKYELLKILKNRVAIVTFLILFFYAFIQGEFEVRGNVTTEELEQYRTLSGREMDEEFISEILAATDDVGRIVDDSDIAYEEPAYWIMDVIGYGSSFKDLSEERIYHEREMTIQEAHELACLTEEEESYWAEQEKEIRKPVIFHDTVVPSGVLEGTTNYMIMMVIIIATGLSSVFAMETQRKTDPMIRATLHGNRELYFTKMLAGMTYILGAIVVLLATFYTYIGIRWGFAGMDYAVQVYLPFSQMNLTNWQLAGILVMLTVLGSLLISAFSLLISNITRNSLAAMAIVIGGHLALFAASTMVPYSMRGLSQFLSLLPSTLVSSRLVYEYRLVKLGGYLRCYQAAPVLYLLLIMAFVAVGYVFYDRYEIKSN